MEKDELILVNNDDQEIGYKEKSDCHLKEGVLHRAFSVFIFNSKNELLLQQRSAKKMLWPLYWSNTCCSHPRKDEDYEFAAKRRLMEELGISCDVEYLGKFQYQAKYGDVGSENEICAVLIGRYDGYMVANSKEVADYKWIDYEELLNDVDKNPDKYTPWFKSEIEKFNNDFIKFLQI